MKGIIPNKAQVERIIGKANIQSVVHYLVQWKHLPIQNSTWITYQMSHSINRQTIKFNQRIKSFQLPYLDVQGFECEDFKIQQRSGCAKIESKDCLRILGKTQVNRYLFYLLQKKYQPVQDSKWEISHRLPQALKLEFNQSNYCQKLPIIDQEYKDKCKAYLTVMKSQIQSLVTQYYEDQQSIPSRGQFKPQSKEKVFETRTCQKWKEKQDKSKLFHWKGPEKVEQIIGKAIFQQKLVYLVKNKDKPIQSSKWMRVKYLGHLKKQVEKFNQVYKDFEQSFVMQQYSSKCSINMLKMLQDHYRESQQKSKQIQRFIGKKKHGCHAQYLVKWKHLPIQESSWQNASFCCHSKQKMLTRLNQSIKFKKLPYMSQEYLISIDKKQVKQLTTNGESLSKKTRRAIKKKEKQLAAQIRKIQRQKHQTIQMKRSSKQGASSQINFKQQSLQTLSLSNQNQEQHIVSNPDQPQQVNQNLNKQKQNSAVNHTQIPFFARISQAQQYFLSLPKIYQSLEQLQDPKYSDQRFFDLTIPSNTYFNKRKYLIKSIKYLQRLPKQRLFVREKLYEVQLVQSNGQESIHKMKSSELERRYYEVYIKMVENKLLDSYAARKKTYQSEAETIKKID